MLDKLDLDAISTKAFAGVMKTLSLSKPLLVVSGKNEVLEKSARNIPYTKVLRVEGLNVYDVMRHEQLRRDRRGASENRRGIVIMNQYDVVVRPIVTEKSSLLKDGGNQYVFEVARTANKIEIAKAVEQLFKVKVVSVRVMNIEGKKRRLGKHSGKCPDWRKAIVKVNPKDKISFFEGA